MKSERQIVIEKLMEIINEIKAKNAKNLSQIEKDNAMEEVFKELDKQDTNNNATGDIGEAFVGYGIHQAIWGLGYSCRADNKPKSYRLISHYKVPDGSPRGGTDYLLSIIDNNGNKSGVLIEAKNWDNYNANNQKNDAISITTFNSEIRDRFTTYDSKKKYTWMTTMNVGNIPNIIQWCKNNSIEIIPIQGYIDGDISQTTLESMFNTFVIDLTAKLRQVISPIDRNPTGKLMEVDVDLLLGKPRWLLKGKYAKTDAYFDNRASNLRRRSFDIPYNKDNNEFWEYKDVKNTIDTIEDSDTTAVKTLLYRIDDPREPHLLLSLDYR